MLPYHFDRWFSLVLRRFAQRTLSCPYCNHRLRSLQAVGLLRVSVLESRVCAQHLLVLSFKFSQERVKTVPENYRRAGEPQWDHGMPPSHALCSTARAYEGEVPKPRETTSSGKSGNSRDLKVSFIPKYLQDREKLKLRLPLSHGAI